MNWGIDKNVTILMATYNGESYIDEQIKSIITQEYDKWELIIRDDNSTDNTIKIVKKYCEIDSRIKILTCGEEHGSATTNFAVLLKWAVETGKAYIMFSDQDDIWLSDKITVTMGGMIHAERTYGTNTPIMVYGGFNYINSNSKEIKKEFIFQKSTSINNLLCDNYVYGCTLMLNLALAQKSTPIPKAAVAHDYWIAMVASCFGKNIFIDKVLLNYRQHNRNVSGNINKTKLTKRLTRYLIDKRVLLPVFTANILMYKVFFNTYNDKFNTEQSHLFKSYFSKLKSSNFSFILFLIKNGVFKADFIRTITFLFIIIRLRHELVQGTIL